MHVSIRSVARSRSFLPGSAPYAALLVGALLAVLPTGCGRLKHWVARRIHASSEAERPVPLVLTNISSLQATAGELYVLRPLVTNRTGGQLSFSISNKPDWASFDVQTGALWGTPAAANVGNTARVVITASTGATTVLLGPLSIAVLPAGTGIATLSWVAPRTQNNGTMLKNLAGYRIYYGASPGVLNRVRQVPDPRATGAKVTGLPSGTWYFAVTAYSSSGAESTASVVVSKQISQ
jgi:hypothetical protein